MSLSNRKVLIWNDSDNSSIKPPSNKKSSIAEALVCPSSKSPILNYNYVAVEGNIGSGKTSLSNQISNDFDSKLILERFLDNPFLANFYKNPKEYAFKLEMSFLADRYQQTKEDLSQLNIFQWQEVDGEYLYNAI